MICLGNELRSFFFFFFKFHLVIFESVPKYYISDSFDDYEGYSISSMGFLPTVVDIMFAELNSLIPVLFSSLIRCRYSLLFSPAWPRTIYLEPWT